MISEIFCAGFRSKQLYLPFNDWLFLEVCHFRLKPKQYRLFCLPAFRT